MRKILGDISNPTKLLLTSIHTHIIVEIIQLPTYKYLHFQKIRCDLKRQKRNIVPSLISSLAFTPAMYFSKSTSLHKRFSGGLFILVH